MKKHLLTSVSLIVTMTAAGAQAESTSFQISASDLNFGITLDAPPSGVGGGGGGGGGGKGGGGDDPEPEPSGPIYYGWMSPTLETAWAWDGTTGYIGQGATLTIIDDFSSRSRRRADLGDGSARLRHGEWTSKMAGMVAPGADKNEIDVFTGGALSGLGTGFNAINLSYSENEPLSRQLELDVVTLAESDSAFITKSAGNQNGLPVGQMIGGTDYLATDLIAALDGTATVEGSIDAADGTYDSVIFVGALDWNVAGTGDGAAAIASYSNIAGDNPDVQRQFIVVGVESASSSTSFGTGLAGTSFAAPIVAGYGAVIASKFDTASPAQVAQRLLETARVDGIVNYAPAVHGQGEADVGAAIAPDVIQ